MARPTKLTPEVQGRICRAIQLGATYALACAYAGVSEDSLARWRRHAGFAEQLKEAEGQAAVGWLALIEQAARDGSWQAAAWKLERRYPHVYGRRVQEVDARVEHVAPLVFDYEAAVTALVAPALVPGSSG